MKILTAGDVQAIFPLAGHGSPGLSGISRHSVPKKIIVSGHSCNVVQAYACKPGPDSVLISAGQGGSEHVDGGYLQFIKVNPDHIFIGDKLFGEPDVLRTMTIHLRSSLLSPEILDWFEQTRSSSRLRRSEGLGGCNAVIDSGPEDLNITGQWLSPQSIEFFIASVSHVPRWQLNINYNKIKRAPTFLKERTEYIISGRYSGFLSRGQKVLYIRGHSYRMECDDGLTVFKACELFEGMKPVDFISPELILDPSVMPQNVLGAVRAVAADKGKNCVVFERLPRAGSSAFVNWISLSLGCARNDPGLTAAELELKYVPFVDVMALMDPAKPFDADNLAEAMSEYQE